MAGSGREGEVVPRDVLPHPLGRESFDAVVSNATLHHLPDAGAALHRLSELVRPGGTLAIVGFTRTERRDWPWALIAWTCLGAALQSHTVTGTSGRLCCPAGRRARSACLVQLYW